MKHRRVGNFGIDRPEMIT